MKYNEEQFNEEVTKKYNGEIKVVSKFKGLTRPILVQDKYGTLSLPTARQVLNNKPTIKDIIRQDIVSTSDESQSSSLENASKLTTQMEDNTL